ncbi:MAG TPA: hypothetical protein VHE30_18580 [Polyangiaceae bacterium]|nr:hypothetical protein [Polyangiaceae bacterium]
MRGRTPAIECSRRGQRGQSSSGGDFIGFGRGPFTRAPTSSKGAASERRVSNFGRREAFHFASVLALSLGLGVGCGGSNHAAIRPEPSVASSLGAQTDFRALEARFSDLPQSARPALAPELARFIETHPDDGRVHLARLYLAWSILDEKRLPEVRSLATMERRGGPGPVRDFAELVLSAVLRREGRAEEAVRALKDLRGKLVDPLERELHAEELVKALVDAKRYGETLDAMLDWAEQANAADREDVVSAMEALLRAMPASALETSAAKFSAAREGKESEARAEARKWLENAAQATLVRAAITGQDPALARRLVESGRIRAAQAETRDTLEALAATSVAAPRVAGRSIGVVLDVTDETSRRRSADAVAGMTRALGLPRTASRADAVHLLTRDAAEPGDVERALGSLAGDGAAILVAGVTDAAAIAASVFAEREQIPVITLRAPPGAGPEKPFTFVLGEEPASVEDAVHAALGALSARRAARVGPGGASCDDADRPPGASRFPVLEWKQEAVDALVLVGDEACARDAALEAVSTGLHPGLVLGPEAARADVPGRKLVVSSGRFPFAVHALSAEEQDWVSRYGEAPSWYEALGHDAAILASRALSAFPLERADDPKIVRLLHQRARTELLRAEGPLWTTDAPGPSGGTVVLRTLRAASPPEAPKGP